MQLTWLLVYSLLSSLLPYKVQDKPMTLLFERYLIISAALMVERKIVKMWRRTGLKRIKFAGIVRKPSDNDADDNLPLLVQKKALKYVSTKLPIKGAYAKKCMGTSSEISTNFSSHTTDGFVRKQNILFPPHRFRRPSV